MMSSDLTNGRHATRRFLAVERGDDLVAIFDPWTEGARTWLGPRSAGLAKIRPNPYVAKASRENADPLIGETLELIIAGKGESVRDLEHIARAPFCRPGVFLHRPDIAGSLEAAGPFIRAAVFEALIGGVTGDDGWTRAEIGDAEVAVDPTTGAWSVENADGHRRSHRNPWGLSFALGAVPNGVFAVRLLEAFFRRKMPGKVALAVSDAIDDWGPTPKEVAREDNRPPPHRLRPHRRGRARPL